MTESYRRETTITPDVMARELRFNESGSLLEWPNNYIAYWGDDYLSKIEELLSEGKPVIICSKNNNTGKQHWVVVTGYNGGGLSTENFAINDPGSSTRKTLNEFLDFYYREFGCTYRCLRYYNN